MINEIEKFLSNRKVIIYGNVFSIVISLIALGFAVNVAKKYTEKVGFEESFINTGDIVSSENQIIAVDKDLIGQIDNVDLNTGLKLENKDNTISQELSKKEQIVANESKSISVREVDVSDIKKSNESTTKVEDKKKDLPKAQRRDVKQQSLSKQNNDFFSLQIGSFSNEKFANNKCAEFNKLAKTNSSLKGEICKVSKYLQNGNAIFRVYISGFESREVASKFAQHLDKAGIKSIIVNRK